MDPRPVGRAGPRTSPKRGGVSVVKLGGSILDPDEGVSAAVVAIYQELRRGRRVLAVVSAFKGVTDELLDHVRRRFHRPPPAALATLLSTGETASASFIGMALDQAGVAAAVADPREVELKVRGPLLDAEPLDVDVARLNELLTRHAVVVLPGFVGCAPDGSLALLGRGGSDFTALFLAHRLGADECRLIKDVDGLYDEDPRRVGADRDPRRYEAASWEEALRLGGELIQPKALRFARGHRLPFALGSLLGPPPTRVGTAPGRIDTISRRRRRLRVALAGLGTVGLGVYQRLASLSDGVDVVAVAVDNVRKDRGCAIPRELLVDSASALLKHSADVVVELMGGLEPARSLIRSALASGRHVVTANKEVMASDGPQLQQAAQAAGVALQYSASVGGAVPVLEYIELARRDGTIRCVEGVLNATCNFVLDRMVEGATLSDAVREAQREGLAEADPTLDLSGWDSACKLALVARAAFGAVVRPENILRRGIQELTRGELQRAKASGKQIKLVARARQSEKGIETEVAPVAFDVSHPLAQVREAENRLLIHFLDGGLIDLHGKGAGRWPTSLAVVADLLELRELEATAPGGVRPGGVQREVRA